MRQKFHTIIGLLGLAIFSFCLVTCNNTVSANEKAISDNSASIVKPITGTWINLVYQDVRNKYTNPQHFDNTDPQMWEQKIMELSEMGVEYLVFMAIANERKAYYPSKIMALAYPENRKSPVEAIMDKAAELNMKVFMSTGWAKDQDDDLREPAIKQRQLEIMEELASIYGNHKALYGWYLPVEDCLCPIFADHAVVSVNTLTEKARSLTPGKKIMISPYGIAYSDFDHPDYEKQLAKLKVDIIAYQDEVGCVREQFPLPNLKKNWQRLRKIHDKLDIELWANCETFTWEKGTNDRSSALIPAAYPRLLSQQVAASLAPVDEIISFMICGIIEDPESNYQLGQPVWSNKAWKDYMDWKNRDRYWQLFEASLIEKLANSASPKMIKTDVQALLDGKTAEEDSKDERWVKFEKGYHELVVDLGSKQTVREIMLRMLDYNLEEIGMPLKTYLFASESGASYKLVSIKDAPYFPNNNHDSWIEGLLFVGINENVRYIKVAFNAPRKVYIDELFINPVIKK